MDRAESANDAFPRVLVVDDEPEIREVLDYALATACFNVRCAGDGHAALAITQEWKPAAIVLDVMMPGIDGFSLLPSLRHITDVPIIMLTGRFDTEDKITGLLRGADDYVTKPCDVRELIARIHARLRRSPSEFHETLTYADLVVNLGRRTVLRAHRAIDLSAREFELLVTLLRNAQRVLSRDELLDLVWGQDRDVMPATVETYIRYLRAKLEHAGEAPLIHTVRGVGYVMRATES